MNSESTTFPRDTKYRTLFFGLLFTTISGQMTALAQRCLGKFQATTGGRLTDKNHY